MKGEGFGWFGVGCRSKAPICWWVRSSYHPFKLSNPPTPNTSTQHPQDEQARLSAEKEIRLLRLLQPCPQIVRCVDAALRPGSTHNCQVRVCVGFWVCGWVYLCKWVCRGVCAYNEVTIARTHT